MWQLTAKTIKIVLAVICQIQGKYIYYNIAEAD